MANMNTHITYKIADSLSDYEQGKTLFREYVDSLGVDLSFQDFEVELTQIEQLYHYPTGALLLVQTDNKVIGCAGIRQLEGMIAELKRMYVQDAYRGEQIGAQLLAHSLDVAKQLGYTKIRLDTLKTMTKAQDLYRSFGFREIPAYCYNPLDGTIYMEKEL